jgi:hypothetical protein
MKRPTELGDPMLAAHILQVELAERNAQALQAFAIRWALRLPAQDAYTPMFRECLTRWFAERRGRARQWMFAHRCERRSLVFGSAWGQQRIPMTLRRQAD